MSNIDRTLLLQKLSLGNSVAEFDQGLDRYFLETETFRRLVENEIDIVAGDKGSGKTAMYRYLSISQSSISALENVTILPGFNPSGNPVFQRLTQTDPLSEGQYTTVWKTYVLSLVGNWVLQFYEGAQSEEARKLDSLLMGIGLRNPDEAPAGVFSRIANWAKRLVNPQGVGVEVKFDHTGIPIITPNVQFGPDELRPDTSQDTFVSHEYALGLLNSVLMDLDTIVWLALDRLDEAFIGYPDVEIPALRALFRTYLDLLALSNIRMKIFVRRDLFSKISHGGFVNLTHVNARKAEIIWDGEDLFALLCRRIKSNETFVQTVEGAGITDTSDAAIFSSLFPSHMDPAQKRNKVWNWMLSRTRDGNDNIQPRNLIDLAQFAKEEQLRREKFTTSHKTFPLIGPEAIKRAFSRLSKRRVGDTMIAEVGQEVMACIEGLRNGKSEHNDESLAQAFGVATTHVTDFIRVLVEMGFLEKVEGYYRVPMLYREGLNITQGKAFVSGKNRSSDEPITT